VKNRPTKTIESVGLKGILRLTRDELVYCRWSGYLLSLGQMHAGATGSTGCRIADIVSVTEVGFGTALKIVTQTSQEGRKVLYIPTSFSIKLISKIKTLASPEPPPHNPRGFKPIGPLRFSPIPKAYLPSSLGVILFVGLWATSPVWALLALIPALHFAGICFHRLELKQGRLIFNTWHHKYNIRQSDITASFFADRGQGWHVIIVRNEDVLRIPSRLFPDQCYDALLQFDTSPDFDPLRFSQESWQYI
jgi:hypothetical protein